MNNILFSYNNRWHGLSTNTNFILGAILLLVLTLVACKPSTPVFQDTEGNIIDFSELRGSWILLNYWASWCPPCLREIPELNQLHVMRHKNNVVVLGVNYDLVDEQALTQIIQDLDVTFPILTQDPTEQLGLEKLPGLPVTYVFAPNGKLSATLPGEQTQASLLSAIASPSNNTIDKVLTSS